MFPQNISLSLKRQRRLLVMEINLSAIQVLVGQESIEEGSEKRGDKGKKKKRKKPVKQVESNQRLVLRDGVSSSLHSRISVLLKSLDVTTSGTVHKPRFPRTTSNRGTIQLGQAKLGGGSGDSVDIGVTRVDEDVEAYYREGGGGEIGGRRMGGGEEEEQNKLGRVLIMYS